MLFFSNPIAKLLFEEVFRVIRATSILGMNILDQKPNFFLLPFCITHKENLVII
jgi:hypothetical protein